MRRRLRLLASPLLVLLLLQSDASAELLLVFAVSRHGARNVLPKTALLAEPSAGTTLLAAGLRQCYQAGLAFRSRYLDAANCSASSPNTCLAPAGLPSPARYGIVSSANTSFSNYNTRVVSSALDRTLLSARSFLAGAFAYGLGGLATPSALLSNGAQLPPIFSAAGRDEDDVLVRAYSKCPLYLLRLLAWYSSPEFDAVHISSAPLRALVAQLPGWPAGVSNDTSLVNWYNIYDAFSVSRSGYGDPMPTVNTTVWAQMKDLADWLETRKSAPSLAGNLLGGPLLQELSNRIAAAVAAASAGSLLTSYTRLMLMSGHYNSQLALLAALNVTLPSMPATASLLAFELHRSGAQLAVRCVMQDGPEAQYAALPLPCASPAGEAVGGGGACTLADWTALSARGTAGVNSTAAWCSACGAIAPMPCAAALAGAAVSVPPPSPTTLVMCNTRMRAVGVGVAIGLAIALLAFTCVWGYRHARQHGRVGPGRGAAEEGLEGRAGRVQLISTTRGSPVLAQDTRGT